MRLLRYRTEDQAVTALAGEPGRLYTQLVWIDVPVRLHKVPNGDVERYGAELPGAVKAAARKMLKAGRSLGITKGAQKHLRSAL